MTPFSGPAAISAGLPVDIPVDPDTLVVFLLVLARTTGWAVAAPLVGTRGLPPIARLAVGVALAVFFTPLTHPAHVPEGLLDFVTLATLQTVLGIGLGFLTGLLLTAVETAGTLVDFSSGFSLGALLDPISGAQSAAFARLANVSFVALLFATDGHEAVVAGFGRSFAALPVDALPSLSADSAAVVGHAVTATLVAALEIGAPLIGVLFLTEAVLAVAARLAPQSSPMAYGMSVKALVALVIGGTLLAVLPGHVAALLDPSLRLGGEVLR